MILDTNGLSAMADGDTELELILHTTIEIAIPAIVLGEYRFGIRRSRNRAQYERWLEGMMSLCQVLAVDQKTALYYADLRQELKDRGRPIPSNDLWIAALVMQHAMPLLSRDRHFDLVPSLKRVDW